MASKIDRIRVRFASSARSSYPRPYEIFVGKGILAQARSWPRQLGFDKAFLVADKKLVGPAERLRASLERAGAATALETIEANEAAKDYLRLFPLFGKLLEQGCDRASVLIAMGGGVIGDLAGFVAAVYLRGIRWVGVPSTVLAQVDSSIGGKTGVNHPLGKNLLGAFHQPSLVVCDTELLATLDQRDRLSGLGEIVKYGLAYDPRFFSFLEKSWDRVLRLEPTALRRAIATSAKWKASIVSRDERETSGLRITLNFGHTLGHAIEGATGFRVYRHGEAVILGMRLALALSHARGHLKEEPYARAESFLSGLCRPPFPPPPVFRASEILKFVKRDKKNESGKLRFVLSSNIGRTVIDDGVSEEDIADAFRRLGFSWSLK